MSTNKCHSISEEADVDSNARTADEEDIVIDGHNYPSTNNTDPTSDTNDLSHVNQQMLNSGEERLKLNVLRLLINLKNNNATETCVETCSRDLINVLNEYKDLDVSYTFIYLHSSNNIFLFRPTSISKILKKLLKHVLVERSLLVVI